MSDGPASAYRAPLRSRLAQGDLAITEVIQLRSSSGSEGRGPGPESAASDNMPYLGPYKDLELQIEGPSGKVETRILRVWTVLSLVISQNCELEWADDQDSRVTIVPVVSRAQWPEAPWELMARTPPPGFLYLPPIDLESAQSLGLEEAWPDSVALMSSACTTSRRVVKPRRVLALAPDQLPRLQDCIARFFSVRGFASLPALESTVGKVVQDVVETGQTIQGPSSLVKVYFSGGGDAEAEDEVTVAYWGVRPGTR